MFENLIAQPAADLLKDDISSGRLPPSILLYGHPAEGKLTAALELGRILSCKEGRALWKCECEACSLHRALVHPDLMVIGARDCILEIRASSAAFLSAKTPASRYLFLRSVRKLVLRFDPAIQDTDDAKYARAIPLLSELDERLEELDPSRPLPDDGDALEKAVYSIVECAAKLEDGFLSDSIPVSIVRNASVWARLAPWGKKKILIVENADRMQEGARNAFLKVLEEPPANVMFVLTTARRGAIMPTILSRVRTYAFVERSAQSRREVVQRVFHASIEEGETISGFLNRYLPISPADIRRSAIQFLDLVMKSAMDNGKDPLTALPSVLEASFDGVDGVDDATIPSIVEGLHKCHPGSIWRLFLASVSTFMRDALRTGQVSARESAVYARWNGHINSALSAVDIYNISPAASLERLSAVMQESL